MLEGKIKIDKPFGVSSKKKDPEVQNVDAMVERINARLTSAAKAYNQALADHKLAVDEIREIKEKRLYRSYCDTFEQFCELKIRLSFSYVYKLLRQAAINKASGEILSSGQEILLIENDLHKTEPKEETKNPKPIKETMKQKPSSREVRERTPGVKPASELVSDFRDPIETPIFIDTSKEVLVKMDVPFVPSIKYGPFDELFYRLTDDIRSGNNMMHLSFLERAYDLLQALENKDEKAHDTFLEINQIMANNGF
jgi:hypothetical protein